MGNKGFSLIELLATLVILSLIITISGIIITGTFGNTKENSYELMKSSIISSSRDYINECKTGTLQCNLNWINGVTSFKANVLVDAGFFKSDLVNPIDDQNVSDCMLINAEEHTSTLKITIDDSNC